MVRRKIIEIDEDKCNGCGECVPACHEGAIQIIDGKARLVDDKFCDGLGDCLGECPQGAITITEREAAEYDEEAVKKRMVELENSDGESHSDQKEGKDESDSQEIHFSGCPGSRMMDMSDESDETKKAGEAKNGTITAGEDVEIRIKSQLKQWPVQLMLAPEKAPYFDNADLLITADCVPFAYPDYHLDLLRDKSVVVGCPKLDNLDYYTGKLTKIINKNDLNSITVAFMEVPCCSGMVIAAEKAIKQSGKDLTLKKIQIGIKGEKEVI